MKRIIPKISFLMAIFGLSLNSTFAQIDTMYIMKNGAILQQYNINTQTDSIVFYGNSGSASNDTLYIIKNGVVNGRYNVNTDIDSIIFYRPELEDSTSGTFTDPRDGNVYQIVQIGTQIWMAENLKYLPSVVGPETASNSEPYYYVYDYYGTSVTEAKATANYATYGVLYNWTAAMAGSSSSSSNPSGVQGVCPTGWHLPSDAEWVQLIDYLGGTEIAGGKLKEAGTEHWESPNEGATNESGFTALPGGDRYNNGTFMYIGYVGDWWTTTERSGFGVCSYGMNFYATVIGGVYYDKDWGFSVRCLKD